MAHGGKAAEALLEFRQAADLDPAGRPYHYALARALKDAGQDKEAQSEFAAIEALTVRERNIERAGTENADGAAFAEKGKLDEAADSFRRAIETDPTPSPTRTTIWAASCRKPAILRGRWRNFKRQSS